MNNQMNSLPRDLTAQINRDLSCDITQVRPVGGSSTANTAIAATSAGREIFVKWSEQSNPAFECEANGLTSLAATKTVRVPEVLTRGATYLVLQAIEEGRPTAAGWSQLGRQLVTLHQQSVSRFGFDHDNFIGLSPQRNQNSGHDDWIEFFGRQRLRAQLEMIQQRYGADRGLSDSVEELLRLMPDLLGEVPCTPCVVHGDLWRGNLLFDRQGQPWLIDPAVYYGVGEVDLAMAQLFGGFDAACWRSYQELSPWPPGWQRRFALYNSYHLLNHYLIYGGSYRGQFIEIIRTLA